MIGICGYYQNDKSALANALRSYVSADRYVIGDIDVNDILVRLDPINCEYKPQMIWHRGKRTEY